MRTNLGELKRNLVEAFSTDLYKDVTVSVEFNDKKADQGCGSVSINVKTEDDKKVCGSLYIVERERVTSTIFVNNNTHDIIFNNMSTESVDKARKYIIQYIERCTKKLLGIEITDGSSPKKKYSSERPKRNHEENVSA
jgi:hypothetical protein